MTRPPLASLPGLFSRFGCLMLVLGLSLASSPAQPVRLNEIVAATNDRLLAPDELGRLRPGTGPFWTDADHTGPGWLTGTAPLGFSGAAGLGTNVITLMRNRTPNLYLRRAVTLAAADLANEGQLTLTVRFDDGFIAWINGKEAARANTGPAGHFIYRDQKAYNFAASTTDNAYTPAAQPGTAVTQPVTFSLGKVSDWLKAGDNILAVQLVNRELATSARIDAQLAVTLGTAVVNLAGYNFDEANGAARVHRNLGGVVTNVTEGGIPAGSWLAGAPDPVSDPAWTDLTIAASLPAGSGIAGSGGLRLAYSQTGANQPATVFSPALPLSPQIAPGALTEADLANLKLNFRFRASPEAAFSVRLDPAAGVTASSLTALPAINATEGTAAAENAPVDFASSDGSYRTRTVNDAGTATTATAGAMKTSVTLISGAAMKNAEFRLTESNTAAGGGAGSTGALVFEVTTAPATPDFFGFYYQTIPVRSWTAGKVTAEQLRAGAMEFDYQLPAGAAYEVYLEPATGTPTYGDRLALGTLTGTNGSWRHAVLETGAATNQAAFLSFVNTLTTNSMRLVFRSSASLPAGTRLGVDNVGYNPWRSYTATLSAGTNAAAFVAALNAQPAPRFFAALEKTGTAAAPAAGVLEVDDFSLTLTKLNAGTAATLVPFAAPGWSYFPGLAEPSGGVVETADFTPVTGSGEYSDWIELLNPGPAEADISNWALTDDAVSLRRFVFPAGTRIAPGGGLVILADGRAAPAGAVWLHAPFSLGASGEMLTLSDASGAIVDSVNFPAQDALHSYGRDPASGQWGYLRKASPGQPNAGPWEAGQTTAPVFSVGGGFHTGAVTLTLSTATPGAAIRYTTNGTEPGETNGMAYTGPVTVPFLTDRTGQVVRARAFAPGLMASEMVTHTYLINQNANLKKNGAVLLSGDPGTVFYKPLGIMAIQGGTYTDALWRPSTRSDYNIPVGDGRLTDPSSSSRPYERPAYLEHYFSDGREGIREAAGLRISSSPYSRPRLVLSDAPGIVPFPADPTRKPSFNVFFRGDYGSNSISYPLIPETEVRSFEEFRLRAGKNDISNPFIRDEFCRRLWTDMGHEGTVGTFVSVYLNGYYKGYYNLVERIREPFMQGHHRSTAKWDVNYINVFEDGDNIHWNTVLQPRLNANLTVKANWDSLRQVLDVENMADYILLNTWAAMWDWPHNNWAMARERSATGVWRCYVWDAEGGLNMGGHGANYQTLRDDLLAAGGTTPIPVMFRRLMTSPEFRLLFADRVQRHLFNTGALTDARTAPRRTATQAEVAPLMALGGISTPDSSWYTAWTHPTSGRRRYLFPFGTVGVAGYQAGQLRDPNQDTNLADTLWPLTLPPAFSQHGGAVAAGFTLGITAAAAPAGSVIYYTTDGTDPRVWGGTVSPAALTYSEPVVLSGASVTVKTRVRNATTNEWSPLTEANFQVAVVPATAANTVISEIMYHPPNVTTVEAAAGFTDPEEFEYIALQNIGASPISLTGLRFITGITFDFGISARPAVDPGQRVVIAKNAAAMRLRYGSGIGAVLGGEFFGNLSNSGEAIRLETKAESAEIKGLTYLDKAPWPKAADGGGPSLVLFSPASNPDHSLPASWTASATGGQPAGTPLALSYAQWAAWTFSPEELADAAATAPAADFDGDGWPNLMEFLLAAAPNDSGARPALNWSVSPGDGDTRVLRMVFARALSTSGYQLQVQSSTDLSAWETSHTLKGTVFGSDGTAVETWEKSVPSAASRQYMRLRAVSVP
ncbi:MAG: CotH kinase family protein [Verrucomicrobiota bacterium]